MAPYARREGSRRTAAGCAVNEVAEGVPGGCTLARFGYIAASGMVDMRGEGHRGDGGAEGGERGLGGTEWSTGRIKQGGAEGPGERSEESARRVEAKRASRLGLGVARRRGSGGDS